MTASESLIFLMDWLLFIATTKIFEKKFKNEPP